MKSSQSAVILVAGQTASGKSALAATLAQTLGGTVINTDAMQIYRGLPVLTSQPSKAQLAMAPHLLYETVAPATAFSAGQWIDAAHQCLAATDTAGQTPIFTGGSGLYFQVLLQGIADIPPIPDDVRQTLRDAYRQDGEAATRARLAAHDPEAATRIRAGDQLRLLRALEIVLATGRTQQEWQSRTTGGLLGQRPIIPILLLPPRGELYAACDQRFGTMAASGALDEAKQMAALALNPNLPVMKIIGLRELLQFLATDIGWEDAVAAAQQATRNYAKRQGTWFRNQWQSNKIGFAAAPMIYGDFYRAEQFPAILAAIKARLAR